MYQILDSGAEEWLKITHKVKSLNFRLVMLTNVTINDKLVTLYGTVRKKKKNVVHLNFLTLLNVYSLASR